nr:unnamed protein product [Callosobruchus chinensis]
MPFQIIHLDVYQANNKKFLTIIDNFSKYAQAFPIDSADGISVIDSLVKFLSFQIVADSGTEFNISLVKEFAKLHRINLHYTTSKNSNSNSPIERFHSTITEHLRALKLHFPKKDVTALMPYAILGYNNSIHSVTKRKPIEIINGHLDARDPFDLDVDKELMNNYIAQHKSRTKLIYALIHDASKSQKEKVIRKANESREKPVDYTKETTAYRRDAKSRGHKLKPPFVKEQIIGDKGIKLKTTRNIYHKAIFKKPRKKVAKYLLQGDSPIDSASDESDHSPGHQP